MAVHETEKTHVRPKAHLISLFIALLLVLIKILRGSKNVESIVGMETCSGADWGTFAAFIVICSLLSWYTLNTYQYEQSLKRDHGKGVVTGEVVIEGPG